MTIYINIYVSLYIICNDFRIFIFYSDLLKYCKALSTEKYKRYINILLLLLLKQKQRNKKQKTNIQTKKEDVNPHITAMKV